MTTVSLEKKVEQKAPELVSLAKKASVSLEKKGLLGVKARVGVVLDASGSMNRQYNRGAVQQLLNRIVPLAVHFDDDGELDAWAFAENTLQLNSVNLSNYSDFINRDSNGYRNWRVGSRVNDEACAIDAVIDYYKSSNDTTPVYIIFISDGGVHDDNRIEHRLRKASGLPIFWQFMGLGGEDYGILSHLDTMDDRVIDNCGFFEIDDLNDVSESELYDRLMSEFPEWISSAKSAGIMNEQGDCSFKSATAATAKKGFLSRLFGF